MTTTTTTSTATPPTISTSSLPSGPVTAPLNFYSPPADGSKPWNYVEIPKEGPQRNYSAESVPVVIRDMRDAEHTFDLDKNAFLPIRASSSSARSSRADFSSDATIKATYYPEIESLLFATIPGTKRVLLFDHTVRRALPGSDRMPVSRVHIDQTPESAAERVRVHMGEDAETLLQGRYRIVNVWRPLNGPVESHPLAVADSLSVKDEALVPVEHRYPHRTGYTAAVKHEPGMKWWYWSGMGNEERLLLQCYDSVSGARVPHSAFEDPRSTETSKPRESIEVRALVFG